MPYYVSDKKINERGPWKHPLTNISYPKNWLQLATADDLESAGVEYVEPTPPTPPTANELRDRIIVGIDNLTRDRITCGFEWRGKTLSSSSSAQANMNTIEQERFAGRIVFGGSFSLPWSTLDGEGFYIKNENDWLSLLDAKNQHVFFNEKQVGQKLRDEVFAKAKINDLDWLQNWVDPRLGDL